MLYAGTQFGLLIVLVATVVGCGLHGDVAPRPTKGVGMSFNLPSPDGTPPPRAPTFWVRSPGAVRWDDRPVVIPRALQSNLYYEGELVIVIGKRASRVPLQDAEEYILGYTCGMDGSAKIFGPDGELEPVPSMAGKSVDGIAPVGPHIVPALSPEGHAIVLRVNGKEFERTHTRHFTWTPAQCVSEISQTMTLEPGDVIFCGARQAAPQMQPGDVFEVEVEGIGVLRRSVVAEE